MNKRIQQLADEAKRYALETYPSPYEPYANLYDKKFAELIVRECISKHRELIARFNKPANGYEHTFPEFMEGVVQGLAEGIEGIQDLFGVEG